MRVLELRIAHACQVYHCGISVLVAIPWLVTMQMCTAPLNAHLALDVSSRVLKRYCNRSRQYVEPWYRHGDSDVKVKDFGWVTT